MVKADRHAQMYDKAHRRLRAQWKLKVAQGNVRCWRCRLLIPPDVPGQRSRWHLDHVPGTTDQYAGPAHARCNELGVLPVATTIVTETAPAGPGRGRITAEERVRRALVPAGRYERHETEQVSVHDLIRGDGATAHHHGGIAGLLNPAPCSRCPKDNA